MAKKIYEKLRPLLETAQADLSEENVAALSECMTSKKAREEILFYTKIDYKIYQDQIDELRLLVESAQLIYEYSGMDTGMSDSEYDLLFSKLAKTIKNPNITPNVTQKGDKVEHRYPSLRGTLDKVYSLSPDEAVDNDSQETLDNWVKRSTKRILQVDKEVVNLDYSDIIVFPKFDGVSCVFEFDEHGNLERALTRGDVETNEAKDITHIFPNVVGPYRDGKYSYGLKTEIMMTNDDFIKCNEQFGTNYKQSRSLVSSIINSDELDGREQFLKIVPLRYSYMIDGQEDKQRLAPEVFNYPYKRCKLRDRDQIREFAEKCRTVNGMRTDGVVIYLTDPHYQELLGRENHVQKFEVAYKFTEEIGYSAVTGIHFSVGLFGTLTPIVDIKPITLKGNTISAPSIGNYGRFKELNLAKGDVVKIIYDIVPYLTYDANDPNCSRSGNREIDPPKKCSECGWYLDEVKRHNGTLDLVCTNVDCPAKEKGRILNYLTRIGIDNVGEATINTLYENKYLRTITDLYNLEEHRKDLIKLEGIGKKTVDYIVTMVDHKRDIFASDFMSALGIKGVAKLTFREVFNNLSFEKFLDLCFNHPREAEAELCSMKGIRIKTSDRIIQGTIKLRDTIEQLLDELRIHDDPRKPAFLFKAAFSKVRDPELEKKITDHGGEVSEGLTNDCSILIVPTTAIDSSKARRAREKGIPIIPIENAWEFIERKYLS